MRIFLIILFLIPFVVISLPLFLIEYLIGLKFPHAKQASSQAIIVWAFKVILFLSGTKQTILGLERIPQAPVLFVSNHRSYFDILMVYTTTPHLTGFISKKELGKIPILHLWMKYLKCLFLDRDDPRKGLKTILTGIEQINSGISMFISPEGTRNHEKEMLPFKPGSLKMAEKTGCPIVPVAISNADSILELHIPWIKKSHVIVEYGEPIYSKNLDAAGKKALLSDVQRQIQKMLEKNDPMIEF